MYSFNPIASIKDVSQLISTYNLDYVLLLEDDLENLYIINNDENLPCAIIEVDVKAKSIQWFEVFSSYRRHGIGKQIIQTLITELNEIDLDCIFATPISYEADKFWRACGFIDYSQNILIYRFK